jgi:hypothetical protein
VVVLIVAVLHAAGRLLVGLVLGVRVSSGPELHSNKRKAS